MNNQVTLVGYVGQTPTIVPFEDTGNSVVKFSLAVKEFSSKSDEEKTMWVDVDAWNGLGARVATTVTQGREVVVMGRLAIASFEKEVGGEMVTISKPVIKLTSFHLCGKRPSDVESSVSAKSGRRSVRTLSR